MNTQEELQDMNGQDLRVVKTKHQLQQAFLQLLQEKSLEQITVTELCRQSGITRKTFYLHFENIPSYFQQFIEQLLTELGQLILTTTKERETAGHPLEPQMIHLFKHVEANKNFYRFIFNHKSQFVYYEMFFIRIKQLVKQANKSYPKEPMLSEFEISYYANAILGIFMEWYYQNFSQSVDEMNELFLGVVKRQL